MRAVKTTAILTLVIIGLLAAGCTTQLTMVKQRSRPASSVAKCLVCLFDVSGSALAARQQYLDEFRQVLSHLNHGDGLIVGLVNQDSLQQTQLIIEVRIPRFSRPSEPPIKKRLLNGPLVQQARRIRWERTVARRRAEFLRQNDLGQIREEIFQKTASAVMQAPAAPNTDILGAWAFSARAFSARPADERWLITFSDMMVDDGRYDFSNSVDIDRIIEQERAAGRIPDLAGVKIVVSGARATSQDTYYKVKAFWQAYAKVARTGITDQSYGSTMPRLIFDADMR